MKKLFLVVLIACLVISAFALSACETKTYEVAMITDNGDITDRSFNQTTYEAVKQFCEDNDKTYSYYKPTEDSTAARVEKIEQAVDAGAKILVMPGYLFAGAVIETCKLYPDVKFIVIDCGKGDYLEYGVGTVDGQQYDYNPENPAWDIDKYITDNVYSIVFQEEEAGFLAGYAAVIDGETNLGFLGGMAVPAVIRFGFGYVQGIQQAAEEMNLTNVNLWYAYGGQFFGDAVITGHTDTWFDQGIDTIFACGGGIYSSAVESINNSNNPNAKLIGVDTDQRAAVIADNPDVKVLTSAMKGLADATKTALKTFFDGEFDTIGGRIDTYGLKTNVNAEYVGLPRAEASWLFDSFTIAQYDDVIAKIRANQITIDNNIAVNIESWVEDNAPQITLRLYNGNLKA